MRQAHGLLGIEVLGYWEHGMDRIVLIHFHCWCLLGLALGHFYQEWVVFRVFFLETRIPLSP